MPIDAKWSPGEKEAFVAEWVAAGKPAFKAFAQGRDFSEKSLREWATAQGAYTPVPIKRGRKPKEKPAPELTKATAPTEAKEEPETVTGQQAIKSIVTETSTTTVPVQAPPAREVAPPPGATEPKTRPDPKPNHGVPPMVWYVVGGVVLVGVIVLIVKAAANQKTAPPQVQNPTKERRSYDEIRNEFGNDPGDIPVPGL